MIILDTHIWIWWVQGDSRLAATHADLIDRERGNGLGVSAISCWEVAKLVALRRLVLPESVVAWISHALQYPGVRLMDLTPASCVEANQLPPPIHRDPADQIIIATARVHNCRLLTADREILAYAHVQKI